MFRALAITAFLFPAVALAQSGHDHSGGGASGRSMNHEQMMHEHRIAPPVTQPGQGAFAAIQEIVGILEADPGTDWSKVNIEGLRQHLIDMDNVTLRADVKSETMDGGIRFVVTGAEAVRNSIRRMVMAHSAAMNGIDGWRFEAAEIEGGATLSVQAPAKDLDKLRGLGFLGVLTRGMHHQDHHMMIARGKSPHDH
ncbi:hypothetical protein PY365_23690 [Roseiarcaceae bacterium H3SJ34-1]|uniref:hypothetical protein n=1 Tax=Terripilifer ovatus TaxID=3032367 RepID=UPI003AB980A7|nr:hypothetical protein [Roseiarcaceae bacterium H3SJ34-1]